MVAAFLDLVAWTTNWYEALESFVRIWTTHANITTISDNDTETYQNQPFFSEPLPEIYLPSELSTTSVIKAFKLAGQKQMLAEVNMIFDHLAPNFMSCEDATQCVIKEEYINETQKVLDRMFGMDKFENHSAAVLVDAAVQVMQNVTVKKTYDSWESLSETYSNVYKSTMRCEPSMQ